MEIALNITASNLPTKTLSTNWYDGSRQISYLYFDWMNITVIEANAFKCRAFRQLRQLTIRNALHIIEYHAGMFNGLQELMALDVIEVDQRSGPMPEELLETLFECLEHFQYAGDIGNEPVLTNIFGGTELLSLRIIGIDCHGTSTFRLIAAENFTGLPAVIHLALFECGIETVGVGAFDQIAETLLILELKENPLLELSLSQFRRFFDRRLNDAKYLVISPPGGKMFDCSMEFYRIRNVSTISFRYDGQMFLDMRCENDVHQSDGPQRQIIQPLRWGLNHSFIQKYAFRAFQLHFDAVNQTLLISQHDPDAYRLFIWSIDSKTSHGKSKCPLNKWIGANVRCEKRNQSTEAITIPKFKNDSVLSAVCVIHISMWKQSLPLHCRIVRFSLEEENIYDDSTINWWYYTMAIFVAIIVLILIGAAIIFLVGHNS